MGWLSALFGSKKPPETVVKEHPAQEYKGYTIVPTPWDEGGQFRVAGLISLDEREHQFVRSDTLPTEEACVELTLLKAKKLIDEQGERIFP